MGGHNLLLVLASDCLQVDIGLLRRLNVIDQGGVTGEAAVLTFTAFEHEYWLFAHRHLDGVGPRDCLYVSIKRLQQEWLCAAQPVRFSTSACNYGGVRCWLHCPQCDHRCFKLFYWPLVTDGGRQHHGLLCRTCLKVTYAHRRRRGKYRVMAQETTQMRKMYRWSQMHRSRLTGESVYRGDFPYRPRRMHRKTFARLYQAWEDRLMATEGALVRSAIARLEHKLQKGLQPVPAARDEGLANNEV